MNAGTGATAASALAAAFASIAATALRRAWRGGHAIRVQRARSRRPQGGFDPRVAIARSGVLRRRQERAAERTLPDVLERVARSLRSSSTLTAAIAEAQPDAPQLLAEEWRRLAARATDAGAAEAAARWLAGRPTPSVRLAAAAIVVAADAGGAQSRALDSVAASLRQRLALSAEIAALGAQARASAWVLGLAPVAFGAVASSLEPAYLGVLFGTPLGWSMLAGGLALQGCGLAWMSRISRVGGP